MDTREVESRMIDSLMIDEWKDCIEIKKEIGTYSIIVYLTVFKEGKGQFEIIFNLIKTGKTPILFISELPHMFVKDWGIDISDKVVDALEKTKNALTLLGGTADIDIRTYEIKL